jgi:hypothetical protein
MQLGDPTPLRLLLLHQLLFILAGHTPYNTGIDPPPNSQQWVDAPFLATPLTDETPNLRSPSPHHTDTPHSICINTA